MGATVSARARLLLIVLAHFGWVTAGADPVAAQATTPPVAATHGNTTSAGERHGGVHRVRLVAQRARWHPEANDGPHLDVEAFGEEGARPVIPGPLVRVPVGVRVEASVRNALPDTLLLFGFGGGADDTLRIAPGATGTTGFATRAPGTFAYGGATVVGDSLHLLGTGNQLLGAIVVDSANAPPDRVFVLSIWPPAPGRFVMAINGRSWPHTERLDVTVGDSVHWRVVNGTRGRHPMHLHGFYYRIDARGSWFADTVLRGDRPMVVTESVPLRGTFTMTWAAERAGNWLFHCHDALHTTWRRRYNLSGERPPVTQPMHDGTGHVETDMSGLVLGIRAHRRASAAAPSLARPDGRVTRRVRLLVNEKAAFYGAEPGFSYVVARDTDPARDSLVIPGAPLLLTRGERAEITVVNRLSIATAVHWHGIELESYYDGVAGWSGDSARRAPLIAPHDSFVVRITPPRAGTFIVHAHADDMRQMALGLYAPLIVLPPGAQWRPATDHVFLVSQMGRGRTAVIGLNGSAAPPPLEVGADVRHRFRFINVSIEDDAAFTLSSAEGPVTWRAIAKDGADLPRSRTAARPATLLIAPGETYDFEVMLPAGAHRLEMKSREENVRLGIVAVAPPRPGPGRPGAQPPPSLPGNVVDVRAGEFFFQAPDTIPAGLTTFELRQTGMVHRRIMAGGAARDSAAADEGDETRGFHMMWLVRLDSGKTLTDFYEGVRAGASLATGRSLGGPGFAFPPRTSNATFVLRPGNYVLACYVGSARADRTRFHALRGMFRPLTVVPAPGAVTAPPTADVVVAIAADGQVTFSTPITEGRVRMRVENAHARAYEVQFRRVLPGRTVAEALAWRLDAGPATPRPFEPWAGLSDVPPGGSLMTTIDFEPGDYFVGAPRVAFRVAKKSAR